MEGKKKRKNELKFPKLFHAHLAAASAFFAIYILFSLVWSPEFLLSDVRGKFSALADEVVNVTARVVGPPQKPVVSASAVCNKGSLYVDLDWADDAGSDSFDIEKDGSPLVSGMTASRYNDSGVTVANTYTYIVTARGSMGTGFAASDPVTVAMPAKCKVVFVPTVRVDSITPDKNAKAVLKNTNIRPTFFGSTNIPFAQVSLLLESKMHLYAIVKANKNGYWSWHPPMNISVERHTLRMTAVSPDDPAIYANSIFEFIATEEKETESSDEKKEKQKNIAPAAPTNPGHGDEGNDEQNISEQESPAVPLAYHMELKNGGVLQGKNLDTSIVIKDVAEDFVGRDAIVRYSITDANGKLVGEEYASVILEKEKKLDKVLPIAKSMFSGGYKVSSEIIFNDYNISRNADFEVLALPMVKLGGGLVINYQDFLSEMGTISIWLLITLAVWLGILSREYWLSAHALRHLTEKSLKNWGMVPMRRKKR